MNIYITKTCGLEETAAEAQSLVVKEAKKIGIEEIRIPYLLGESEKKEEMSKRIDGVLTGVNPGDTVIYQSPTWNDPNFDIFFMNKLFGIGDLNIIIFIHDVRPMMFQVEKVNLPAYIQLFDAANSLIVSSENMRQYLREKGVNTPMTVQHLWDSDMQIDFQNDPDFKREINFVGDDANFLISKHFSSDKDVVLNLHGNVFLDEYDLLHELHKGGFGLVWTEEAYWREYMKYNISFKTSTYLRAGIPIIIHKSNSCRNLIEDRHWGIAVDSLEEAVDVVNAMTAEEYGKYVEAIKNGKLQLENGYFTKKALVDSIFKLFIH